MKQNPKNENQKQKIDLAGMETETKEPAGIGTAENSEGSEGPENPEVVDNIRFICFDLAEEYIKQLDNPEDIYTNNGLFVDMLKYIYNHYIGDILNNKTNTTYHRYNFRLLDIIFYTYTSLVYKYKQNNRPNILEFSLFTHVDRLTLYNASNGLTKKLTNDDINMVKRWFQECENQLTNGSSVFEIFLLKSQYHYNDNLSAIPLENQGAALSVNELPDLGLQKIAKKDD